VVFERLVKLDDVRVVHDLHDGNFLFEAVDVLHLPLGNGFDCTCHTCRLVVTFAHCSIGTLTELLLVDVIEISDLSRIVDNEAGMFETTFLDHILLNIF